MKTTRKILGGIFLLFVLSTLVSGGSVTLHHGTNSLVAYDDMDNLTDRTLTINWSNNFTGYDGNGGAADVVIAIYVPVDYGVISIDNVTINDNTNFQKYNVSAGNCTELNTEANKNVWHTNCTLITINGTLQNPAGGFSLTINITLSDSCANTACVNKTYELMFSDLITYKKLVNATCNASTYNWSGNGDTYCYITENNTKYSCAVASNQSGNVSCNIIKGIGNMYNTTDIMEQGTTGKLVTVPGQEFVIKLYAGWNLFSIPLQLKNDSLESVLAPINGKYTVVYEWNADIDSDYYGWVKHTDTINDLTILKPGVGYWIYCNEDVNLTVKGTLNDVSLNLFTGWNMFGWKWKSLGNKELTSALSPISGDYTVVYEWNADINSDYYGWVKHTDTINDLTILKPGVGYWIYMQNNKIL